MLLRCADKCDTVRKKHPELWSNNWFFHHDNDPAHDVLTMSPFLTKNQIATLEMVKNIKEDEFQKHFEHWHKVYRRPVEVKVLPLQMKENNVINLKICKYF